MIGPSSLRSANSPESNQQNRSSWFAFIPSGPAIVLNADVKSDTRPSLQPEKALLKAWINCCFATSLTKCRDIKIFASSSFWVSFAVTYYTAPSLDLYLSNFSSTEAPFDLNVVQLSRCQHLLTESVFCAFLLQQET